ncbi:interferon-induced protein 44-like [Haliotis rufescens]|uniref:interferon-induced protein 44-like n=1 Tax=Haliotis rufescens TaxID=6454 RepID=UPI00201E7650|nr:interferon-induced protein 44-like [Haliotis rufescens]
MRFYIYLVNICATWGNDVPAIFPTNKSPFCRFIDCEFPYRRTTFGFSVHELLDLCIYNFLVIRCCDQMQRTGIVTIASFKSLVSFFVSGTCLCLSCFQLNTFQEFEQLQKKFFKHLKDPEEKVIHAKILIFGPTGSGKSSFCNGLRSALKDSDTPATYYAVGNIGTTLTSRFQSTQYGDHWIIDMPGIFESSVFKTETIEAIASGKVRFDAQITKTLEVEDGQCQQKARRDVSCVVLVLHHNIDLGEELKRQLDVIIKLGGDGALSYHLVLTHLDECDPQFKDPDNLPNLYTSPLVQEAVKNMSEQTGIPAYAISYVKNYVTETETDTKTKLLHLRALDRILTSAAEQVEKLIDLKRQSSMYDDAPDA